jgi:hypothetical protein
MRKAILTLSILDVVSEMRGSRKSNLLKCHVINSRLDSLSLLLPYLISRSTPYLTLPMCVVGHTFSRYVVLWYTYIPYHKVDQVRMEGVVEI